MSLFREAIHRDTILFINSIRPSTIKAIDTYRDRYGKSVNILVIVDSKKKRLLESLNSFNKSRKVSIISCNLKSPVQIKKALSPYIDRLLAVSSQFENSIPELKKVLPHVPYLNGPTEESLDWATDKVQMRNLLKAHNSALCPPYTVVSDDSEATIEQIEKNVGYPLVVKPSGLAASMLVTVCYHREELEQALRTVLRKIAKVYRDRLGRGVPQILVEHLMEGSMYSIDGYVNNRGTVYWTPPVHVKTGRAVGFDDFFGYQQLTPTKLTRPKIEKARQAAGEAIKALGLRSTTCHVELMKTVKGWKIIELAPRMGGFRHTMYSWSFGINHILNDILIRIPQKPVIPKKRNGFTAVFKIFAKKEGVLESIIGLKKIRGLESFVHIVVKKKKGDQLLFANHGGSAVVELALFNKVRANLLADIRRMEKSLKVEVAPKKASARITIDK